MTDNLTAFLTRHDACAEGLARLAATGAATPEEAWARAADCDLIWAVTRPGVMSAEQLRRFLTDAVLTPIKHLLGYERSKNILRKLRTNSPITVSDRSSAWAAEDAARAAAAAARAAACDASAAAAAYASRAAADAAASAADAAASAADASRSAAAYAAASAADAAREAAYASRAAAAAAREAAWAAWAAARAAQAKWIRDNFVLGDLNIN